MNATVTAS